MVQAQAHELLNQKDANSDHKLVAARDRLVSAFSRLEEKLQHVGTLSEREVKQHEQLLAFERENIELKSESEQLSATITELENQYAELHKVAGAIYSKLDDSIKRLSKIIEG